MRLQDKKAIVTGGGGEKGIGRAIVRAFAAEGADVCVVGLNEQAGAEAVQEVTAQGRDAFHVRCDISQIEDIDRTVAAAMERWECIDVLVNNAGISIPSPFLEVTPQTAWQIWRVNQFGTFFMGQRVARTMAARARAQGWTPADPPVGKIVNISSLSEEVATLNLSHYAATKGAIRMMTRCWALELAPFGVLVNGIGAGFIETNIAAEYIRPGDYETVAKSVPLKRCGQPRDIAGPAVFLASSESDYATGATLFVDGGYVMQSGACIQPNVSDIE